MSNEFCTRTGKRVLEAETSKRVSRDASVEINKVMQEYAEQVAVQAQELAESDGRVTIRKTDVRQALHRVE